MPYFLLRLSPSSSSQPTELLFPGFQQLNINRDWEQWHFMLNQSLLWPSFFVFNLICLCYSSQLSVTALLSQSPLLISKHLITLPNEYLGIHNATHISDFSNHVGIDINSLDSIASVPAAYYTHGGSTKQNLILQSGKKPIHAWIDYDSIENIMNVTIAPSPERPTCLSMWIFHRFSKSLCTASTGNALASSHYILGWSFKINGQAQAIDLSSLPSIPRVPEKHTNLTVAVSVSSVVLVTIAISIVIYLIIKIKNADVIEDWTAKILLPRTQPSNQRFQRQIFTQTGRFRSSLQKTNTQVAVNRVSNESNQGLRYEQTVIHRDIKASNVLLDDELHARLGDFGLARLYEHGSNPRTTRVVGTMGYLAPELPKTGKVTTSSDVYAFGAGAGLLIPRHYLRN
ncbi:hypothetical protein GQ457_02G041870 [Hibiscus cannabinus]